MTVMVEIEPHAAVHSACGIVCPNDPVAETQYFVFPLSPLQEQFWRANRELPGNSAYNGAFIHELTGPLDVDLWERAWNEVVQRHEALRASVRSIDGRPMLAIAETMRISLVTRNLVELEDERREIEKERLIVEDARYNFILDTGPLIRIGLICLADNRYVQTVTLHHLVCDGWSIGILMDELPQNYAALVDGRLPSRPDLEIQFGDYLSWQEEHLASPEFSAQIDYWTEKLEGYRRLDVAPDLSPPPGPLVASNIVSRTLSDALMGKLKAFCNAHGSSIFIAALTALVAMLHRETGRIDIGVGSPVAGRSNPDLEKLVGPLLNHLVMRIHADENMTLLALEETVRETVLDALANQDVPLECVIDALNSNRATVPDPFYSVSFVSQRAFAGGRNFTSTSGGVNLRTLPSKSQGALYDIFFFLIEREDGWRLSVDYRTGLFSTGRATYLLDRFIAVIEQVIECPTRRLGEIGPARAYDSATSLATTTSVAPANDAFAPTAVANNEPAGARTEVCVVPASFSQERFWLLGRGGTDTAAFNMPAVLRISGPLDAGNLQLSIRQLISRHEILRTRFEIIDGTLHQVISPSVTFNLVKTNLVDTPESTRDGQLRDAIRRECRLPFELSKAPLIRGHLFELSVTDHALVLTLHDIVSDAHAVAILQRELWTIYDALSDNLVPSLPEMALQYGDYAVWQREWIESEAALGQLQFWKDKLAPPLPVVDFPLDRLPGRGAGSGPGLEVLALRPDTVTSLKRLAQSNSATMFAVTGAAFAMLLARYARQYDVLFGSPVANRSVETEGLLGRFSGPMAIRLDLSGDPTLVDILERARDTTYEALGNTEYPFELLLEQIDARSVGGRNPLFQFYFLYQTAFLQSQSTKKLRIEPMPSLGTGTTFELQLAVIERSTGVAAQLEYSSALIDASTARGVLDYFTYVLDVFTTDPTRRLSSLKEPDVAAEKRNRLSAMTERPAYAAPRTVSERRLVAIWERILKQAPIGIHDDFFDLGGQSILAARLVMAIETEFEVKTGISTLAWARTIELLAGALQVSGASGAPLVVPMNAGRKGDPLFLVHCGGGHVLRYQNFVSAMPADQPIFGIGAPPIDEIAENTSVETLARKYVAEIRKVQPQGPYRIGGYSFGGLVAYEMGVQLRAAGERIGLLAIFDTANPSHYRGLPSHIRWRMRLTHLAQVAEEYLRLLLAGNFDRIRFRIKDTAENYARKFSWRLRHMRGRLENAPSKRDLRDFLSEFSLIASRYAPPPLAAGVVLFYAENRGREYRGNPTLGWDKLVQGGVTVRDVPGDHESLMQDPNATALAGIFDAVAREISERNTLQTPGHSVPDASLAAY